MIAILASLAAGVVLGAGLALSQMMNPAKVIGFLSFAQDWDPTLALVMIGALIAAAPGFALARKRLAPVLEETFQIPSRRDVDPALFAGAAIFGVGWGLAGFCPGPALAALSTGMWQVFAFVAAMIVGMVLFRVLAIR
jgi:uncharacterized membrane protein YedE/YeeE